MNKLWLSLRSCEYAAIKNKKKTCGIRVRTKNKIIKLTKEGQRCLMRSNEDISIVVNKKIF